MEWDGVVEGKGGKRKIEGGWRWWDDASLLGSGNDE